MAGPGNVERPARITRQTAQMVDKHGNPIPETDADRQMVGDAASIADKLGVFREFVDKIPGLTADEARIILQAITLKVDNKDVLLREFSSYSAPIFTQNEDGSPDEIGAQVGLSVRKLAFQVLESECKEAAADKLTEENRLASWKRAKAALREARASDTQVKEELQQKPTGAVITADQMRVWNEIIDLEEQRRQLQSRQSVTNAEIEVWDEICGRIDELPTEGMEELLRRLDNARKEKMDRVSAILLSLRTIVARIAELEAKLETF